MSSYQQKYFEIGLYAWKTEQEAYKCKRIRTLQCMIILPGTQCSVDDKQTRKQVQCVCQTDQEAGVVSGVEPDDNGEQRDGERDVARRHVRQPHQRDCRSEQT